MTSVVIFDLPNTVDRYCRRRNDIFVPMAGRERKSKIKRHESTEKVADAAQFTKESAWSESGPTEKRARFEETAATGVVIDYNKAERNVDSSQKKTQSDQPTLFKRTYGMLKEDYDEIMNQSWADLVENEEIRKSEALKNAAKEDVDVPVTKNRGVQESISSQNKRKGRVPQKIFKMEERGRETTGALAASSRPRTIPDEVDPKPSKKKVEKSADRKKPLKAEGIGRKMLSKKNEVVDEWEKKYEQVSQEPRTRKQKKQLRKSGVQEEKRKGCGEKLEWSGGIRNRTFSRESSTSSASSISDTLRVKEDWYDPKLGWCRDEATLVRRTKEIDKAKEKPVYKKYKLEVPRHSREHDMPKTPNKYIKYSRRSWDKQVRLWKLKLYKWAGWEPSDSCASSVGSSSDAEGESTSAGQESDADTENTSFLKNVQVGPDAAASLLGHLDLETQSNTLTAKDERTMQQDGDTTRTRS